ncbi:MAG: tRNA(Ile)-lysidine synthase [Chlamydiae bacterium]|nr:tRNA(Ile)-lysidine synthase [Chlamydiota bacterium]
MGYNASMEKKLLPILTRLNIHDQRLLVAVSTGADSMALLHLLLNLQKKLNLELFVAHINHNMRQESQEEEAFISDFCKRNNLPFYSKTLEKISGGNVEDRLRKERYNFLLEKAKKLKASVCLAHHLDDLAETVLKRFFENPRLYQLKGMQESSQREGVTLLRPLLSFRKQELLGYLNKHAYKYFEDMTNLDLQFTRNRMRHNILPTLEQQFGKSIQENLQRHAYQADLLEDYLNKKIEKLCALKQKTKDSVVYDFSNIEIHPLELQFFLEKVLNLKNLQKEQEFIKAFFENTKFAYQNIELKQRQLFVKIQSLVYN